MKTTFLIIIFSCTLILSSCSNVSPTTIATKQPTNEVGPTAYPILQNQSSTAYPNPENVANQKVDLKNVNFPKEAPIPENGKASISGALYSISTSTILKQFMVYVTPAQGTDNNVVPPILAGPLPEKGDVKAVTDQNGAFEINNLPPGNYYIVVRMPTDYAIAQTSISDDKPIMITLAANQHIPLEVILVP